jgi:[ribosomal protein S18]-alanine N-acetyltransferase
MLFISMTITIQKINLIDTERLAYIGRQSLPIYYNSIHIFNLSIDPNYILLKSIINDTLVGLCFIKIIDNRYHIMSIAVLDTYRRQGVGNKFIKYVKENYTQNKQNKISLYVQTTNVSAINFYKKNSFIQVKKICNYYEGLDNPDAYYLEFGE